MPDVLLLVFQLVVLIFSVMIHEIAHGYVAEKLGDPTARLAGRLTLNPLSHLDPIGSVLLPLILFFTNSPVLIGWAKPVPYNPYNLYKDYKYGPLKVALAGPASNILMLLVFGLAARIGAPFLGPALAGFFGFIAYLNIFLAVFNLVPIPPLDGSKLLMVFLPRQYAMLLEGIGFAGIFMVLIFLFLFSRIISAVASWLFVLVAGENVYLFTVQVLSSAGS